MSISKLGRKLRLQDARRALILNAPTGYFEALGDLPEDLELDTEPDGTYDFAQLFVTDRAELEDQVAGLLRTVDFDAILWIAYPKGSSGVETNLNRDKLRGSMLPEGIRPVSLVSVDETWSAMRFRPSEQVGR